MTPQLQGSSCNPPNRGTQGAIDRGARSKSSAKIGLSDTNLVAPMPGVIVEKNVEPGSLVAAGTPAFTLDDTRVVKVNFGVPDSMLAHFKMGAPVPVEVEALGRTFTGRITEIAASANRESRVFNIEVTLRNRDRSLKVGMIASVRIDQANPQTGSRRTVDSVDYAGIGIEQLFGFHHSKRGGKQFAQLKSVRIGEAIGKSVVINEGLLPGERIIVNRTNQLTMAVLSGLSTEETRECRTRELSQSIRNMHNLARFFTEQRHIAWVSLGAAFCGESTDCLTCRNARTRIFLCAKR